MGTKNFTIDTKGSCFMCLKHKPEEISESVPYSLQRLSKYLHLDFKNVYHISFPMEVSVLADSEILVSLCNQCSIEANKFIKLHKDLELIRKRVNVCVGRIQQSMLDADREPSLLQEYRQRMTSTANPLELIQASIAENLRKETIEKCSQLTSTPATTSTTISTITLPSPAKLQAPATPLPTLPVITAAITTQSDNSSSVSSTTSILPTGGGPEKKEVLVVDIDDSEEEEDNAEPELVISSVTGASGTIFSPNSQNYNSRTQSPSQPRLSREQPSSSISITSQQQPSTSFSALQNFTTGYDFLNEFGLGSPTQTPSENSSASFVEDASWKRFSNGKCECKHCGKMFDSSNSEGMTVHQRMHAGIKPIICQYCNQKFRSVSNRRIHTLTYHRRQLFAQFQYPAVSNSSFQLAIDTVFQNVWKLNSESDRPFMCIYCPKQYRHKLDVEAHLVNIHFNEVGSRLMEMQRQGIGNISMSTNPPPVSQQQAGQMSCQKCGLEFTDPSGLTRHSLNCPVSGESRTLPVSHDPLFSSRNDGQQFGNPPPGKKSGNYVIKWKCGICTLTFSSQLELKRHKSLKHGTTITALRTTPTESGSTKDCQYCGKKFRFLYSQRVHMLTLHRYQVFSKYVPAGTTLEAIENAIQTILEKSKVSIDRTHVCKFCNRDFTGSVASILQNHILVSHFQEVVKRLKETVKEAVSSQAITQSESIIKEENENTVEVVLPD